MQDAMCWLQHVVWPTMPAAIQACLAAHCLMSSAACAATCFEALQRVAEPLDTSNYAV